MSLQIDVSDLDSQCHSGIEEIKEFARNGMRRAGEIYNKVSRENGSYQNQTGNLRNSNGYGIAEEGVLTEVHGNITWEEGAKKEDLTGDLVLECGAGENYASHVQRKNYDVTDSGQLACENELRRLFK